MLELQLAIVATELYLHMASGGQCQFVALIIVYKCNTVM
jgi:hypothetical protein